MHIYSIGTLKCELNIILLTREISVFRERVSMILDYVHVCKAESVYITGDHVIPLCDINIVTLRCFHTDVNIHPHTSNQHFSRLIGVNGA